MARSRKTTVVAREMHQLQSEEPSGLLDHLSEEFRAKWRDWVGVDACSCKRCRAPGTNGSDTPTPHGLPPHKFVCWKPTTVAISELVGDGDESPQSHRHRHRHHHGRRRPRHRHHLRQDDDDGLPASSEEDAEAATSPTHAAARGMPAFPNRAAVTSSTAGGIAAEQPADTIAADFVLDQRLRVLVRAMIDHRDNHGDFNRHIPLFDSPEYRRRCPEPMWLDKVKENLYRGDVYATAADLDADVERVFQNAIVYHTDDAFVARSAREMLAAYHQLRAAAMAQWREARTRSAAHACSACEGRPCGACGYTCLEFKRVELMCSSPIAHLPGRTAGCGRRISPNTEYYRTRTSGQHWCARCFRNLPSEYVDLSGALTRKSAAERLVHNDVNHEKWVRCVDCAQQFHRICIGQTYTTCPRGGFVKPTREFRCRVCAPQSSSSSSLLSRHAPFTAAAAAEALAAVVAPPVEVAPPTPVLRAADVFPACSASRFIEQQIREHVLRAVASGAASAECAEFSRGKNGGGGDAVEQLLASLTVRVTSRVASTAAAGSRLRRWMRSMDPAATVEYPYTSKVVSLFQRIGGADVLLFVLYLQEYSTDAPPPNTRSVYIAYLDSINSMAPRSLRSTVYQQMVGGYITWAKVSGFRRVYIWSCPPTKNQNYALHCHPPSQRTPDSSRLRRWYGTIVKDLTDEGTVLRNTTLHEAHFSEHKPFVATRRDFWPQQAEIIIREYLECPTGHGTDLVDQSPAMRRWWQRLLHPTQTKVASPATVAAAATGTPEPEPEPTPQERLSWLMSRVATRVAGMNKHFMVLDLCVECSLCGRGGGARGADAAPEHWVCSNRSCRYTLCTQCLRACGGTPKPALMKVKQQQQDRQLMSAQQKQGKQPPKQDQAPETQPGAPPGAVGGEQREQQQEQRLGQPQPKTVQAAEAVQGGPPVATAVATVAATAAAAAATAAATPAAAAPSPRPSKRSTKKGSRKPRARKRPPANKKSTKKTKKHHSERVHPLMIPLGPRPAGFRPCTCDVHGARHKLVHEVVPPGHYELFRRSASGAAAAAAAAAPASPATGSGPTAPAEAAEDEASSKSSSESVSFRHGSSSRSPRLVSAAEFFLGGSASGLPTGRAAALLDGEACRTPDTVVVMNYSGGGGEASSRSPFDLADSRGGSSAGDDDQPASPGGCGGCAGAIAARRKRKVQSCVTAVAGATLPTAPLRKQPRRLVRETTSQVEATSADDCADRGGGGSGGGGGGCDDDNYDNDNDKDKDDAAVAAVAVPPPASATAAAPPLSTVFDDRLLFLWFCQKHHLQFDQLRRARFSTQMIFRNLHARIVPVAKKKQQKQCGKQANQGGGGSPD